MSANLAISLRLHIADLDVTILEKISNYNTSFLTFCGLQTLHNFTEFWHQIPPPILVPGDVRVFDQCDLMISLFVHYLAICSKVNLASSIKMCQSRFKFVPNTKQNLKNYPINVILHQSGEISPNLFTLVFVHLGQLICVAV